RDALESLGNMRVTSVGVRGVEKAQATVVTVEQKIREAFNAQRRLMRVMPNPNGASAHGEAAGLDAGAAECDSVRGGEFRGKRLGRKSAQQISGGEPCSSRRQAGVDKKFASVHGITCPEGLRPVPLLEF